MTIRVLVVEDSLTVRRRLCEVLSADPSIEIVAEASDGKLAVELCAELRPDIVTLDMLLPVMSGLAATEYIMANFPTPILIVSASFNRGELFKTYDALAAGAVDVLEKPRGDEVDGAWESKFVAAVKMVSRIKVITHPRVRLSGLSRSAPALKRSDPPNDGYEVMALGASTGGPAAIMAILRELPGVLRIPVLVVLHIGEPFGAAFAEWLGEHVPQPVVHARHGQPLDSLRGKVVMAPPGQHTLVRDGRVMLTRDAERHFCRPSVDVLFESLAAAYGAGTLACLLTGMGRDGAAGLLAIRKAGGLTIAQDEATSVVYGMPREAAILDAAARVLPLPAIGAAVAALLTGKSAR